MVTAQQIQQKINEAKADPNGVVALELRKRLETGAYDNQLKEIGLVRTPQGLKPSSGSETRQDIKETGQGIKESIQKRLSNIDTIRQAKDTGEQSGARSVFQTVGQVAGGISDVIGEATIGAGKALLPQETEDKISSTVQAGIERGMERADPRDTLLSKYQEIKQTNPKLARDIDSALGITALGLDVATVGVGSQGAKATARAGKRAVDTAIDTVSTTARQGADNITEGIARVASDFIPSTDRIVNTQVTKALDLTAGDVKNINLSTGNEVGEYLATKNLIGNTKDETQELINNFYETQYNAVRSEIGKVDKVYDIKKASRVEQALKEIKKKIKGVSGLEDVNSEVDTLLKKKNISLNDAQRTKELLDEHFQLYKVTGDVKEGTEKSGLDNIRRDIKEFIEKEVKDTTGEDIASLNNDVATSRAITDAIVERSTRGLTRSNIKLGDLGVFGVASSIGSPLFGAAAVFAKKIIESPTIQLRMAKYLDGVSDARKIKLQKVLEKGEVPKELSSIVAPKKSGTSKLV